MDHFFSDFVFRNDDIFWYEIGGGGDHRVSASNRSAFRPYTERLELCSPEKPSQGGGTAATEAGSSSRNVKRRMADLMRRVWEEKRRAAVPQRERCRRHMMNERLRRERQKQSYSALHSLLPDGTKNDKNSIIQTTLKRIQELQRYKRELERRIHVLEEANPRATTKEMTEIQAGTKINIKLPDPTSGIDSMEQVLRCLKNLGTSLKTIQAKFSPQELSAALTIETQVAGAELEKAVEKTLQEAEWKLLFLPEA